MTLTERPPSHATSVTFSLCRRVYHFGGVRYVGCRGRFVWFGWECAEQSTNVVQRGCYVGIGVGVYTAGDGGCLYGGQGHPFQG